MALGTDCIASWPVADTIIINGDTIYIEKRERVLNLDSLQEESSKDVIDKKIPEHRFSTALQVGWNQTIGTFQSSYQSLQPLDNVISREKSKMGNTSFGADIGYRFWSSSLKRGELHLSAHLGFGYNEINIRSSQMDESPFEKDSIIGLQYADNALQLHYFTIFDTTDQGIIGELDTMQINTRQSLNHFRTWDFPIKLRVSFQFPLSQISLFAEVGIMYRAIQQNGQSKTDNYLVNESAEYKHFSSNNFKTQNIMSPLFSVGWDYHFGDMKLVSKHWSASVYITACLPSRALNPEGYFVVQSRNHSFKVAVRRTF